MENALFIKDIIITIATVFGVVIAGFGVNTWRRQLVGKVNYDLARRLLKAVYELREAITFFRNPLFLSEEVYTAMKQKGYSDEDIKNEEGPLVLKKGLVYESRWKQISSAISNLNVEAIEAEVIWGGEVKEKVEILIRCTTKLHINLRKYYKLQEKDPYPFDDIETVEKIIYDVDSEQNPFNNEIDGAIISIEGFLKPYLKI